MTDAKLLGMSASGDNVIHGAVGVVCRDGRFLCLRRAKTIPLPGWWCFPGGAVEDGETHAEAAAREVREEAGLDVEPVAKLWEWTDPEEPLILHFWHVRMVDLDQRVRLNPAEASEHRWLTLEELRACEGLLGSAVELLDAVDFSSISDGGDVAEASESDKSVGTESSPEASRITRRHFLAGGTAAVAGTVLGDKGADGLSANAAKNEEDTAQGRPGMKAIDSIFGVIQTRPVGLKLYDWHKAEPKRYENYNARLNAHGKAFDRAFFEHVETRYIEHVCGLLDEAGRRGIDLVLLPEAMLTASRTLSRKNRDKNVELLRWSQKAWFDAIRPIAKKHEMIIASCLYQVDDGGHMSNDGVLTDADGSTIGVYRKVHLPGWHDQDGTEVTNFVAGDTHPVFDTRVGRVGFLICYDIDFPEAACCLALNGAQAILHPTVGYNFPDEEEQVAEARLRTRATDHHCVVACAMPGAGPVRQNGCSAIVDHRGTVVAAAGKSREAIIQARVTLGGPRMRYWGELASNARDTFPRKRRPDTYGVICETRPPAFPKEKHKWGRYYLYEKDVGLP